MIQVNGEKRRVVRLACGYLYRLKPEDAGVKVNAGETVNRWQLVAAVRKHYLEGK